MRCALLGSAVLVTLAACSDDGGDRELHVAVEGDDAAPGTAAQPFRTLARARDAARRLAGGGDGDVVIQIHAGVHRLDEPLTLSAGDSGAAGHRVVYQAAGHGTDAAEDVTISGGRVVTGWQPVAGSDVWRADVGDLDTRQLYVGGVRAPRARRDGDLPGAVVATETGYETDSAEPLSWQRPEDIELVTTGAYLFAEARCGVAAIAAVGGRTAITMDAECHRWARRVYTFDQDAPAVPRPFALPTAVENSPSFLEPGSWYLDRSAAGAHALLYRPRAGEDMTAAEVIAPRLEALVVGEGAVDAPLHDVAFRGLTFADTTWLAPSASTGFVQVFGSFYCDDCDQGGPDDWHNAVVPAAVTLASTVRVAVEDCRFRRLGATALLFGDDTASAVVRGNRFEDVSAAAVELYATEISRTGNVIANNLVRDIGVEYRGAAAISVADTEQATIEHNLIEDLPYSGIVSYTGQIGLRVLHNEIARTNRVLEDGGGIYLHGKQAKYTFDDGALVRGNVVYGVNRDGVDPALGIPNAIYADAEADLIRASGNVVFDSASSLGGVRPRRIVFRDNYWDDDTPVWYGPTDDVDASPANNTLLTRPGREACQAIAACAAVLGKAGLEAEYRSLREP